MSRLLCLLLLLNSAPLAAQRDTIYGDLNADGTDEMLVHEYHVIADDAPEEQPRATARVYRCINDQWEHWPAADGFLMHAYAEAGLERFTPMIERGALVLRHGHAGYVSFETTHRFRWQNERFELIGYTFSLAERCDRSEHFDYNLSTGRYTYEARRWTCDDTAEGDESTVTDHRTGRLQPARPYLLAREDYLTFDVPPHNNK